MPKVTEMISGKGQYALRQSGSGVPAQDNLPPLVKKKKKKNRKDASLSG